MTRWPAIMLVTIATSALASPARAQSEGGSRIGLFGRERPVPEDRTRIDLVLSAFQASDRNLSSDGRVDLADPRSLLGPYSGVTANLTLAALMKKFSVTARALSTLERYPAFGIEGGAARASVTLSGPLGDRGRVDFGQTADYAPAYDLVLTNVGETGVIDLVDRRVLTREARAYATSAGISWTVDRRSSVAFEAASQHLSAIQSPAQRALTAGGRYQRQLTKHASVRLGYAHRSWEFGDLEGRRTVTHDLDAGIDYSRALSFSKRTTFSFGTGSAIVATAEDRRPLFFGQAQLRRDIGRTWTAAGEYSHQLQFIHGFADPYLADSARLSTGGYLGRRVDVAMTSDLSKGTIGFGARSQRLTSFGASARLRLALSRRLALYSEYAYYHHRFGADIARTDGRQADLDRQRVKVGLVVWAPLKR